ncbi:MAG: hypothetical protein ACTSRW_16595 [Candidatus Helarchaeota archaeon]
MIAIIPIFFENDHELWHGAEREALILKIINSAAKAHTIKKLFLFTSDKSIHNLTKSLNIDSYVIDIETDIEKSELLPRGTYSSVRYLQATLKVNFDNLIILSFRNPLVTPALINKVINKFKLSKTPVLISLKKSVDHPVQLDTYYRIVDVGYIHIFDNDRAILPYLKILNNHFLVRHDSNQRDDLLCKVTKPFHFDWERRGIKEKSALGMYIRMYDNFSIKYIPVEQIAYETLIETLRPLWIYDTPKKAKVLFPFNKHKKLCGKASSVDSNLHLVGTAFSDDFNNISSLLFKDIKEHRYFLSFNSEDLSPYSYVLKALPVGQSGPLEEQIMEVEFDDFSKPIPLQDEDKYICGIIYSLLKIAEDETYDLCEPFPPDERLWTRSDQTINVKTGKVIMGRQDFPDVFEPDGTFFIMKKSVIPFFDQEVLNGNADGFVMEDSNSIQIKSEFDLLRYRAITRANDITSISR